MVSDLRWAEYEIEKAIREAEDRERRRREEEEERERRRRDEEERERRRREEEESARRKQDEDEERRVLESRAKNAQDEKERFERSQQDHADCQRRLNASSGSGSPFASFGRRGGGGVPNILVLLGLVLAGIMWVVSTIRSMIHDAAQMVVSVGHHALAFDVHGTVNAVSTAGTGAKIGLVGLIAASAASAAAAIFGTRFVHDQWMRHIFDRRRIDDLERRRKTDAVLKCTLLAEKMGDLDFAVETADGRSVFVYEASTNADGTINQGQTQWEDGRYSVSFPTKINDDGYPVISVSKLDARLRLENKKLQDGKVKLPIEVLAMAIEDIKNAFGSRDTYVILV